MLHASSDELWVPDASRVPVGDSRALLAGYLSEWRQLAQTYGGEAHLLDEEFVGGSGEGLPQGTIVPRPLAYFQRFYDARASFSAVVKAACRVRTAAGACTGASGTLGPMGAWPLPEQQSLLEALIALETYLSLGTLLPSSTVAPPVRRRKGPLIALAAAGVVGLGLLTAGLIKSARS